MISLEKRFDRLPDLKKETCWSNININKRNDNFSNKANYIPHHAVTNINKKNSYSVQCRGKCQSTSLSENLLKGPDLLNNLVGVPLRFHQGKFCIMTDIKKMFHQVKVNQRNRYALKFIWRRNRDENFQDIQMNVHLFGKVDLTLLLYLGSK